MEVESLVINIEAKTIKNKKTGRIRRKKLEILSLKGEGQIKLLEIEKNIQ
jgi:transcriptional antiterminator Rof (Rho-off)